MIIRYGKNDPPLLLNSRWWEGTYRTDGMRGLGLFGQSGVGALPVMIGQIQQAANRAMEAGALGLVGGMEFAIDGRMSTKLRVALDALVPGWGGSIPKAHGMMMAKWYPKEPLYQGGAKPATAPLVKKKKGAAAIGKKVTEAFTPKKPGGIPWKGIGLAALLLGGGALALRAMRRGRTVRANPRRRRRHLRVNGADAERLERAVAFREDFHWGIPAGSIGRRRVSPRPRVLVKLGDLESVTYSTEKGGDGFSHYVHAFGPSRKPVLAVDFDNRRLHVVGGGYTVTDRGIER